jgi:hypothetical protein
LETPLRESIKLKCDEAYKDSKNIAGCGKFLWDTDSQWLKGCIQKIEPCDALYVRNFGSQL